MPEKDLFEMKAWKITRTGPRPGFIKTYLSFKNDALVIDVIETLKNVMEELEIRMNDAYGNVNVKETSFYGKITIKGLKAAEKATRKLPKGTILSKGGEA